MAVIENIIGLKAEVVVDGATLREYDNDEEEQAANTVTKYIEAMTGATFKVQFQCLRGFRAKHDMVAYLYIDGTYAASRIAYMKDLPVSPEIFTGIYEEVGSTAFMKDFCFSELHTDDVDIRTVNDGVTKKLKELGNISLKLFWVEIGEQVGYKPVESIRKLGTIAEKALKGRALSHQASVRERRAVKATKCRTTTKLYDGNPFATFTFKYRSLAALKALCIIPRSPTPVPLEERDVDELTPAEMRELLRRQREREQAATFVKRELKRERSPGTGDTGDGDADDDNNGEIEFVWSKRRRTDAPVFVDDNGVETIDLT